MAGILYIVATPIGNLEDITYRAVRVLRECQVVACEDTRQTRKLLDHYGISTHSLSYHDHNEASRTEELLARLESGEAVALVSDAGTPLVSDPGYRLVHAACEAGITVVPIPGASALLAALTGSGLPMDRFEFRGFLPAKAGQRLRAMEDLRGVEHTVAFYEAPHRIAEALTDIAAVLPGRQIVVARELTKLHEEFLRGTAATILAALLARPAIKGEITLLIGPGSREVDATKSPEEAVRELESQGMAHMDAVKQVAHERGIPKRELYRRTLETGNS